MATIRIDGRDCPARLDENLLQACLESGADLPYFCWHPELGSVGACRQCAVRQFAGPDDTRGRIVMACMTPVTDGAILSIEDQEARDFRAGVIEWLMTNHPHDCPVCAEGGECHLQDMTVMTGHAARRYRFPKRTHRNQDLGPFVRHEMNRCIACYRCVRFYRDYAGGTDLAAFGAHNDVYFGRAAGGVLESGFAGNLVEICPTGVFTDKPFTSVYVRKWDMDGAPSVCPHCAVGCNTIVNARQGSVRRVINRYHDAVNRYFLCDRGRFGHGFAQAPSRPRVPLRRVDGQQAVAAVRDVLDRFADMAADGPVVGIGSARASVEANFALRNLVGPAGFSTGLTGAEHDLACALPNLLRATPARNPTLHDMERADAVLILGEDVAATAPRVALALRQAVRQPDYGAADAAKVPRWMDAAARTMGTGLRVPLFVLTPGATGLDDIAEGIRRAAPDDIARLGFAIAHRIDMNAPEVADLTEDEAALADRIARALSAAGRPLIVTGSHYGMAALPHAAANIATALAHAGRDVALSVMQPDCNSMGVALLGGVSLDAVAGMVRAGGIGTLVVMENDLTRRMAPDALEALLAGVRHLVVIDHVATQLMARADIVLPSAAFSECAGTLVSAEGRAQRFLPVLSPDRPIQAAWRWARDLARAVGRDPGWADLDSIVAAIGTSCPALAGIGAAAPDASYRLDGQRVRSAPPRFDGRTAMRAQVSVRDRPPVANPDTPLSPSMEGSYGADMPGALVPYYQQPGWNSVQALNRFQQEIGGPMRGGDAGVRLLDGDMPAAPAWHADIPPRFVPSTDRILLLPQELLFGTEELSTLSPPVAARAEPMVLRVGTDWPADATLLLAGQAIGLPVVRDAAVPPGVALCPAHAGGAQGIVSPVWADIGHAGGDAS
ncbi:NADH-quinone oxidoreductase, chain G [Gluconacetobacter diazotrophicus PA1 5]|uniref:NADH-quinone oxidoreductase subunit G n=3 Tax=Gluconacetobacter diazotrophicus TaxID=33996 RepID=A9HN87_GLUDA|nr:NADH-quinone oxidoreductase subunit NuoG [Gluconacetobacter diazotrophicus]ACI50503.1 NADH-quinone oxidoreductase, chain G [Gluconacetobacter diazotrophicus PA1 5]MBB2155697.1 NADH-quinone oxidoreductase subunit NuoG [Gluconacetobacter diazotrophicus]TWB02766.1 NADH dehydrogenase subunit G [Gluconacetobacter diazotrophicus]CAP56409.1 putative NADH-quinone oxidoreductase chain 3 [Gluconacetobacter diazotrophicus PA1 5]